MINNSIWSLKYKSSKDKSPEDTFRRVATAISNGDKTLMERFFEAMVSLKFIPGGRILSYAGTDNPKATFANCYVMGSIEDSMEGIMKALEESALTLKAGGGIGLNFSTLRPEGDPVRGTSSMASGPVSFMEMWNSMSRTISGVNKRKGAMIAVLNVDHPDIEKFITSKANNTEERPVLEKFNISIGVTDEFMKAVIEDRDILLRFNGTQYRTISARSLMHLIVENAWAKAEPGVVFLDTINRNNNLWYCETIQATNPCGEIPLPPYGACMLGAINLTQFVKDPFGNPDLDWDSLKKAIETGVVFLDNTIDLCYYPVEEQRNQAVLKRRIGLGVMGLGSTLAMLKVRYGSEESIRWVKRIFEFIRNNAYRTSIELAKIRGPFPMFRKEEYLQGAFIQRLPEDLRENIKEHGIRNACLLTIAPTGSISQLVGYVSSGVEPIYRMEYVRENPEYKQEIIAQDYSWAMYKKVYADADIKNRPEYFITALELTWKEHIDVMAACQYYIDNSISKTINLHENISLEELHDVYFYAWQKELKGCTIFREGSLPGILKSSPRKKEKPLQVIHKTYTERPERLPGTTFKIKIPEHKFAFYLTFTYYSQNGKVRPYELFINTKNPIYEEWTKALGRLISAVFRNVDDPTFLVDELKEIMGKSGFWSVKRRKYVPSLIAEIGETMKDFFIEIGLMEPEVPVEVYSNELGKYKNNSLHYCPVCGQAAMVIEEGCIRCLACDYNKCG